MNWFDKQHGRRRDASQPCHHILTREEKSGRQANSSKIMPSNTIFDATMWPTAIVTIQSKLFICHLDFFPLNRSTAIMKKYVIGAVIGILIGPSIRS